MIADPLLPHYSGEIEMGSTRWLHIREASLAGLIQRILEEALPGRYSVWNGRIQDFSTDRQEWMDAVWSFSQL